MMTKTYTKMEDVPKNLAPILKDVGVNFGNQETVEVTNKPKGSTLEISGDTYIILPPKGSSYNNMLDFHRKINLKRISGWDIRGVFSVELAKRENPKKPGWLIFKQWGDRVWLVYKF